MDPITSGVPGQEQAAVGTERGEDSTLPLRITVSNGDLSFVRQPLLLGHYRSLRLTGTEHVIDRLIGGTMENSLAVGLYPDVPGTHQVFFNTCANADNPLLPPRPEAVIVAGLGEESTLKAAGLIRTVRQAILAWAHRVAEGPEEKRKNFELAATLLGSGGTSVTPGQAAQLIAQGTREANELLVENDWPRVRRLILIELYLDRAREAWQALREQALAAPVHYELTEAVTSGHAGLPRPLTSGYRGAAYDLITAETRVSDESIVYRLDTRRARSEVRAQSMQGRLLRELVANASSSASQDRKIGRTLFKLLVPVEMEPYLGGTTAMVLKLDQGTAGIPWELLDSPAGGSGDPRPWAIRTKLLRKLRTADFRARVSDANAEASVLVIGEPQCDPPYERLYGARTEAEAVADRLKGALGGDRVCALVSPDDSKPGDDAYTIINTLMERPWRILHVSGHGEPPGELPSTPGDPQPRKLDTRGVVLSNGTFLGPREIRGMREVPELVFMNCCFLARRDPEQVLRPPYDQPRFAATVAEALINAGVRCVIAAGWVIDDDAAQAFATTFYDALLRRERFIDAVATAREEALRYGGNTWAAYQCYGDPDWRFKRNVADPQRPHQAAADDLGVVASKRDLALALEILATESKSRNADPEPQRARLQALEKSFAEQWGGTGFVAEAFGTAYVALKDSQSAIEWYRRALAAEDGSASLKAAEQLSNLRVRLAWEEVDKVRDKVDADELQKARTTIQEELPALERLVALRSTSERESLCGSAYKRLAMIERMAGDDAAERQAIENMKKHYQEAETLARAGGSKDLFYPLLNRMVAELIVEAENPGWPGFDSVILNEAQQSLETKTQEEPEFWSVAGCTELKLYTAVANGDLATHQSAIEKGFNNLHGRIDARHLWSSVYDQAYLVLPKYSRRASPAEQQAATALLALLEGMKDGKKEDVERRA